MKTDTDNRTEERKNRFNGESIMLTKQEAAIHDRIFINEYCPLQFCTIILKFSN